MTQCYTCDLEYDAKCQHTNEDCSYRVRMKQTMNDVNAMHPSYCTICGKYLKYELIDRMPTLEPHSDEECLLNQVHNL
jgi:hypothetical protein